ncbi:hypothetical protein L3X37_08570 [Sabulilitoribacter arenilitoris]|uniref:Uncharacterized protein n=1 Tax=Wocania arenilitoris TaxID=2044858 RepID=A0AAE3JLP0_9FLAO|nr:hypothetical protein [Wocania arenilitoris]MCF7568417.1 hypothetical protein [Wocania arenilitoris]
MIEEDELINIWQSSSNQERIKFEKSKLILEMKSSLDRFNKSVKYRDLTEYINAIIMIPLSVYAAYALPYILSKIGALFLALLLIYVVIKLKSLNKHKPNILSNSYIDYLYQCRNYLSIQKKLRETAPIWYILPLLTGALLFALGVILSIKGKVYIKITVLSIIAVGVVATYFYNIWIIKKQYIPRLKKMDELIKAMET